MGKKRPRSKSASPVPTTPSSAGGGARATAMTSKKKKISGGAGRGNPRTLADTDSLERVPSALGRTVRTVAAAPSEGDLVVARLRKEVCNRFGFSLSASLASDAVAGTAPPSSSKSSVVRTRLLVGSNACTRALESAAGRRRGAPPPSLAVLARDVRPPTAMSHIPALCRDVGTPLLLLPGKASVELGRALGARSAAALIFLPRPKDYGEKKVKEGGGMSKDDRICHRGIDSFVQYAKSKIPE
mmetsp:Transcript_494/g.1495  ORF Transcript_494/g.1495 Transcript_494/m.1495 type:complete len:243 (-) Transcript_494:967-1695(-)